jgi:hypothetical protein
MSTGLYNIYEANLFLDEPVFYLIIYPGCALYSRLNYPVIDGSVDLLAQQFQKVMQE